MLSKKQLQNVCLMYDPDHKTCRYIGQDDVDYGKWHCVKHKKNSKDKIDEEVKIFILNCRKKNIDPAQQGMPIGDNCSGYPILKNIEQGYDKDP